MNIKCRFKPHEVVYCPLFGYGSIREIDPYLEEMTVVFSDGNYMKYWVDGKLWRRKIDYENGIRASDVDLEKLEFKIGDKVVSERYGRGYVSGIDDETIFVCGKRYPVIVVFKACERSYTLEGLGVWDDSGRDTIHHVQEEKPIKTFHAIQYHRRRR